MIAGDVLGDMQFRVYYNMEKLALQFLQEAANKSTVSIGDVFLISLLIIGFIVSLCGLSISFLMRTLIESENDFRIEKVD